MLAVKGSLGWAVAAPPRASSCLSRRPSRGKRRTRGAWMSSLKICKTMMIWTRLLIRQRPRGQHAPMARASHLPHPGLARASCVLTRAASARLASFGGSKSTSVPPQVRAQGLCQHAACQKQQADIGFLFHARRRHTGVRKGARPRHRAYALCELSLVQ